MTDQRARPDLDLFSSLRAERATLTGHYQELARFIWPDHAVFNRPVGAQQEGEKRAQEVVDPTAPIAADRCASALMSMTAPTHKQYQKLDIDDEELRELPEVKAWLEFATDTLFRHRYAPLSGFAAQYHEGCKSAVVFGPMVTFVEDGLHEGPRYVGLSLSNTYFTSDAQGRVNGLVREESFNASQLADKFGVDALPQKVRAALSSPSQGVRLQPWTVVHVVQSQEKQAATGFTYVSRYSMAEGYTVLEERGYRVKPFAVARYSTMPSEKYGRSIAMLLLPAIKGLNRAVADYISGVHRQVDPPLLAFDDDGAMTAVVNRPGRVTSGGLDSEGRHLVAPLSQPGNLGWADSHIERQERQINDGFMTTLFQILTSEPSSRQQTAYEVSVREVEKAALLSPATDKINDEYFGALVPRELDILTAMGRIPPMPEVLRGREHEIKVTHTGELSLAQQADELLGIQRTLEVAPLFQAQDQTATRRIKWDAALKRFAEGSGMAANLLRTDEEFQELAQADEQAQAAAQAAELAPGAGTAAKSFAEAEQIRQGQAAALGGLV
jgi:hypothetical protein